MYKRKLESHICQVIFLLLAVAMHMRELRMHQERSVLTIC